MRNPYRQLMDILPQRPLQVGDDLLMQHGPTTTPFVLVELRHERTPELGLPQLIRGQGHRRPEAAVREVVRRSRDPELRDAAGGVEVARAAIGGRDTQREGEGGDGRIILGRAGFDHRVTTRVDDRLRSGCG